MRKLLLATTAVTFVASAGSAFAQDATQQLTATAEIAEAIALDCGSNGLSFGTISVPNNSTGTTITLSQTGEVVSGDNSQAYPSGGAPTEASCTVQNETGGDATVSMTPADGNITLNGPNTATMAATLQVSQTSGTGGTYGSNETFAVHGVLTVAGNEDVGQYTGTIDVTVHDNGT